MMERLPAVVGNDGVFHLSLLDYLVFGIMLVASICVGLYSALKARGSVTTTMDFLLGGRHMPILPVALSLLGGVVSALSILGNSAEVYLHGTQLSINLLGSILGIMAVRNLTLPVLNQLDLVSMMQYVELRFNSMLLRKMVSMCHLLFMLVYLGICLYAPSLATSSITSLPIWASIISMGLMCTIYITLGGVKAVVYTDVIQTLLMLGGVVVVAVYSCIQVGGLQTMWDISYQGGRIQFFNMDPSPFVRHTFWSTLALGCYFTLSTVGLSQSQFQRFSCVKTVHQCKWILKFFTVGLLLLWGLFYFSGLVAYAIYKDCDPLTSGRIEKGDQIIPYLVMDKLSHLPGLAGLFLAAVYGGVLSSMSSQANSAACLVWEDFLKEYTYFQHFSDTAATNVVRALSAIAGLLGMCLAFLVAQLGQIFTVAYSICGALKGPVEGLFLAGICMPWTNKKGAIVGLMVSLITSMWLVIGKLIHGGGSPPNLPLSTEGCPENMEHFNTTLTIFNNLTSITNTSITTITTTWSPETSLMDKPISNTLYHISYCYSGVVPIIITMVVSGVVSLCTGPVPPSAMDERMVNLMCARLYRHVWKHLKADDFARSDWKDEETAPTSLITVTTPMTESEDNVKM
ncbi:sodium-coupled monocarboxylate transporter 1-like isoform X1 [Panulirus ornatus]|uniref:sodium-coupled monocarboxylate transporter 1-like isoform X1 n=1 Tax=Panulirus ornatus TaxID=150431 RepID=UPI003A8B877F